MHDIPTTVHRAARVVGALGVDYLTLHAQGGVAMLRAGVEGLAEGAAGAGLAHAHRARGHGPHERRRRSRAHPAQAGRCCSRERLRRHRVRGERRARRRALRPAAHDRRARHPAGGHRRITIRPAPRRLGTRSMPVPICSSSDGPSRRRQTRPQPRLPWSHPSPETPDFLANRRSQRPQSHQNKRRLTRGPTRESPALGCRPCRILPPVSRPASGRSEEGGRGSHSAGRAQGEAQDGLGHPS